ncbi:hypothetical protein BC938DRAFT_473966 [Jimgerdemannia flammicorona]|uniref:Uncharacterized protein n=1 Tax=Jimgerdemannia flammicorona TaxID=994334 RepID=A0A433Q314_9FUNG|nr:hypothetical protein BC938DRAFT_473966 [Jimgerdemannia flammicorona]
MCITRLEGTPVIMSHHDSCPTQHAHLALSLQIIVVPPHPHGILHQPPLGDSLVYDNPPVYPEVVVVEL